MRQLCETIELVGARAAADGSAELVGEFDPEAEGVGLGSGQWDKSQRTEPMHWMP